jgi:hypothetical protein
MPPLIQEVGTGNTLQSLLKCSNDRVFDLTMESIIE